MAIIKWILAFVFMLVILLFGFQNMEQTASVRFLNWTSSNLPLCLFLYAAFVFGMLFGLLICLLNILKLKTRSHKLAKENRKIKEELNRLRNVNIEEELESDELDEDGELEKKARSRKKQ